MSKLLNLALYAALRYIEGRAGEGIAMVHLPPIAVRIIPTTSLQAPAQQGHNTHSSSHRLTGPFLVQQSHARGAAAYAAMQIMDKNKPQEHFNCYL
jgi:hypothetical protein